MKPLVLRNGRAVRQFHTTGKLKSKTSTPKMANAISSKISRLENGQVEIPTPRLLLRGATEDDAQDLHDAFSDAEVMRYW